MKINLLLLIYFVSLSILAEESKSNQLIYSHNIDKESNKSRFRALNMNSAIWQFNEHDDNALEASYSFAYIWFDCRRDNTKTELKDNWETCKSTREFNFTSYLSYTGQFDFYLGTRNSGPVINRVSNPALHFQVLPSQKNKYFFDYIDLGIEHRSNGQTTEIDETDRRGILQTQRAYENGDYAYLDGISRGANYISLAIGADISKAFNWEVSIKNYWSQDSDVNWGSIKNDAVKFSDYDLVNLSFSYSFEKIKLATKYTFGHEFTDTDSIEFIAFLPYSNNRLKIPFILKVHFGPMENLSNYTDSVINFGIGIALSFE